MNEVQKYRVSFKGRTAGAIGIHYHITDTIEAKDIQELGRKLYEKYEHIVDLRVNGERFDLNRFIES